MPISGNGWELHVERLGLHVSGGKTRTYGQYQVYRHGNPSAGLSGFMCESIGPGANSPAQNGKRVAAGRYPALTHFGRYVSIGYSQNQVNAGDPPMPAFALGKTEPRTGILIHPAHPPTPFLSSIGCLNPTRAINSSQDIDFWDSRSRVIGLLDDLKAYDPAAFRVQSPSAINNALVVIDGEPMNVLAGPASLALAAQVNLSLPITMQGAIECAHWMMDNFAQPMRAAVADKPYGLKHLCGIVCQETAYKWLAWKDTMSVADIVARCVFDASGDFPGTTRSAFPANTAAFRARYGQVFADMLIEEANKTRRLQHWSDKPWIYKGYGLFQYDLQNVVNDQAFFEQKEWYNFAACLSRVCGELDSKLVAVGGDLWKAIKAYNGSGPKAAQYAENVRTFSAYCETVTG